MNTKKILAGGVLAPAMALTLLAPLAFADNHEVGEGRGHRTPLTEDQREDMKAAFEAEDYDAFLEAVDGTRLVNITEEQFDSRVEKFETKQAIRDAVEDGDYNEFRGLVGDERATEVTSSNFHLLTAMHEARESGDEDEIAEAKEALKEEGIKKPGRGHKGPRGNGENKPDFSNLSEEEREELKAKREERRENGAGFRGFFNRDNNTQN